MYELEHPHDYTHKWHKCQYYIYSSYISVMWKYIRIIAAIMNDRNYIPCCSLSY